jgi:hypothetical protein
MSTLSDNYEPSLRLDEFSVDEGVAPDLLENTRAANERHLEALRDFHEQHAELIRSTVRLGDAIGNIDNDVRRLAQVVNRNDARRRAHVNRHDRLLEDTNGRVNQHQELHGEANRQFEQHAQNLEEHGSRLESLERSHQWWIPAAWSVGTTVVCGLLVWGFTKLLGEKKTEDRRQEPKEPSDEEMDVEDSGIPVGRKRPVGKERRGRRPHARAWRVAPS